MFLSINSISYYISFFHSILTLDEFQIYRRELLGMRYLLNAQEVHEKKGNFTQISPIAYPVNIKDIVITADRFVLHFLILWIHVLDDFLNYLHNSIYSFTHLYSSEYFQSLDEHMRVLSLKLAGQYITELMPSNGLELASIRFELYMNLLKMHSVVENIMRIT